LQAVVHAERARNHVGLVVRFQLDSDVRLLLGVRYADGGGGGCGGFERVRHRKRDVLAVIANDVVFERRATLVDDAFEPGSRDRTKDLADILAMKHRSHAGHFLGRVDVELDHTAIGDRRLNRHRIQLPGKTEVRAVLRRSAHLQGAIHARRTATDR
jgi:hypothetical protein